MKNIYYYKTSIGKICIEENGMEITKVYLDNDDVSSDKNLNETVLIKETAKQFVEYLEGKRKRFEIPLVLEGTDFQKKVWTALLNIPYGKTCSYSEIAETIGQPKSARAVGMANNKNPILILVPCHRVIGKNGNLVGYAAGIELKKYLLRLENDNIL